MKSCDKFGNINVDDIDQQTFFAIFLSMLLHGRAANFLNTPRTSRLQTVLTIGHLQLQKGVVKMPSGTFGMFHERPRCSIQLDEIENFNLNSTMTQEE